MGKDMKSDAFTYDVIEYNSLKKEYTLKHRKTGILKIISKLDFDYHSAKNKESDKRTEH